MTDSSSPRSSSSKAAGKVMRIDRDGDGTVQSLTRAMQLLELLDRKSVV